MDLLGFLQFVDHHVSMIDQVLLNKVFCFAMVFAALMNKNDDNVLLLIFTILVPQLFDILFFHEFLLNNPNIKNYQYYLLQIPFDLTVLTLIAFRVNAFKFLVELYLSLLSKLKIGQKSTTVTISYRRHIAEFKLMSVYALFCVVNIFMSAEYAVRSVFGSEFAYIYYSYTPVKVCLYCYAIWLIFKIGFQSQELIRK